MARIIEQRVTARHTGEICVFLIGMRVNKPWKVHKWLPVARAMPRMIRELEALADSPLLGSEQWFGRTTLMLQYWRSYEELEHYSRNSDMAHRPAWADFNRRVGSNGDVGIWHETYRLEPGQWECVYNNMPAFGLAGSTETVPATGPLQTAAGRLSSGQEDDPAAVAS
jgi:hypothetical protein